MNARRPRVRSGTVVRSFAALIVATGLAGLVGAAPRPSQPIVVHAEDWYLIDGAGLRIGREHVGSRLRIDNVAEVRGVELTLAAIDVRAIGGQERAVLQLVERSAGAGDATNICKPRGDGSTWVVPIAGRWTETGELRRDAGGATLACASGALAKCIEWGFAPWIDADDFTACTRMVRADYCGDGRAHTRPGIRIAFERSSDGAAHPMPPAGFRFEASWGRDGAHCVVATRVADLFSLEDVLEQCPERAAARDGCAARTSRGGRIRVLQNFVHVPP